MGTLEEENAILERQREYFASDERIRDLAEPWRTATPEECLAATAEACAEAFRLLMLQDPETRARSLEPEPLPADTIVILEALQKC